MKHVAFLLLAGGLTTGLRAAAQSGKPVKTEFLDEDFLVQPSEAGAVYRRETEYTSAKEGVERDYFLTGKPAQLTSYENLRKQIRSGPAERWYENGHLQLHREYAAGKASGELRTYYASGQLKRREHYAAGKRLDGECFGPDGTPVAFFEYEVLPVYASGNGSYQEVLSAVQRSFRYPPEALRAGIGGQVLVGFKVTKEGEVTNIHLVKPLSAAIDAEAMRAVQSLRRFTPGQLDGEPVAMRLTVPLNLAIVQSREPLAR